MCANSRTVSTNKTNSIALDLPQNISVIFIVTSHYFDKNVNDERNEFKINDSSNLIDALSWNSIIPRLQQVIDEIILKNFPQIEKNNTRIISEVENEFPYLTPYIDKDKSKIKNKEKLIDKAKKEFEREKK